MFLMVIKLSIHQHIYDSKVFEECLNFNSKNKDIDKILVITDFIINIKNNKVIQKIDKSINNLDILTYVKKIFPNNNIILSHPYIKIKEDLSKLDKDTRYISDYLDIYPNKYNKIIEYNLLVDIFIQNYKKEVILTPIEYRKNNLTTIIVSYKYIDILQLTLPLNIIFLKNIYVVTDSTDVDTIKYCEQVNVKCLKLDIVEDGKLNKSRAINLSIELINPKSYILLLDSDIIVSNNISIDRLKRDVLYSAKRIVYQTYNDYLDKISVDINEPDGLGFFQLFHIDKYKKYPDSKPGRFSKDVWSDRIFSSYFKEIKSIFKVSHIGLANNKWNHILEDKQVNPIEKEKIFVGIAAIPTRENSLKITIESLINQTDNIGVYLNGWGGYIPEYLNNEKILVIKSEDNGDYGDAGKFYWIDNFKGYYFSCDDDIIYPDDYIERTIKKINFYNKKAVIGFHGSVILPEFTTYYDNKSRWVLSFRHKRGKDEHVHILGTGTIGFHTSTIKVNFSDFNIPNIADIFFAMLGQKQKIPFIVQQHELDEMRQIVTDESLSRSGMHKMNSSLNTTDIQNNFIKERTWEINYISNNDRKLNILMIGRFDTYKKGGIYKSNINMKLIFEKLGHNVFCVDSMESEFKIPSSIDLCIIYPGDLSRPDFDEAEKKMTHVLNKGIPCCINMSYLNDNEKTLRSVERFRKYINKSNKIFFLTFTQDVRMDPLLEDIKDLIVPFPKTIKMDTSSTIPSYKDREGIIIGDVAKLQNNSIINGNAQEWIDSIKIKLPDVKIYAYKQYGTKTQLNNLELIPYTTDGFSDIISKVRISVCINQKATFEMLPVESQLVGTPVVYRNMPQSLNQWIGFSGICVNTPNELSEFVCWLYNNEDVWNKYSNMSILNSERNKIDNIEVAFDVSLRKIMILSRN
jgi:hypothetical protein